jgi:tripartite-type tricarboxylate transporter receptor subunit TctC
MDVIAREPYYGFLASQLAPFLGFLWTTNMNLLHRRRFFQLTAGSAALANISRVAWALDYPTRPVRIIVGFPAGQSADVIARLMGEWLSERLARPFIIENRPGAGTNIATEAVARADPDGYTLLCVSAPNVINTTLYPSLKFNFIKDLEPIGSLVRVPFVLLVNKLLRIKNVQELIAFARANPNKVNYASSGIGSVNHMAGELFKIMAEVEMAHIPYKGMVPAVTDLISGQVHVLFADVSSTAYVNDGKLSALAVTTSKRLDQLPDVPAVSESVPGFEVSGFLGIAAPKETAPEIVAKLNSEINAGLTDIALSARLRSTGSTVFEGTPAAFRQFIAQETDKWGKVIQSRNIKPE